MSKRPGFFKRTSGIANTPSKNAAPTRGTLIKKAECQLKCSRRNPPSKGPTAVPTALTADQAATAIAQSLESIKNATNH